ncbi:MAG: hypothetical protein AB7K68_06880 [Bacteriovoracia bacterium]
MKILFATISLALATSSAMAGKGESCLDKKEMKMLSTIRGNLVQAKVSRPDCARLRGAGACISPADQANMQFLERKENGDAEACGETPDQQEIDSVGEEANP